MKSQCSYYSDVRDHDYDYHDVTHWFVDNDVEASSLSSGKCLTEVINQVRSRILFLFSSWTSLLNL